MNRTIAVAGKGGTGKTTVAALVTRELKKRGKVPILAVDADPVANLGPALGIIPEKTVGQIGHEFLGSKLSIPEGMSKTGYLELRLNETIAESKDIDLVTMGQAEGPGCYCSVHNILGGFIEKLAPNYQYVVVDNEAGMEHLSRRTIPRIDSLLLVSDPTRRGLKTIHQLLDLIRHLDLELKQSFLVIDRGQPDLPDELEEVLAPLGLELLGVIPEDEEIARLDLEDKPLTDLSEDSSASREVARMCDRIVH